MIAAIDDRGGLPGDKPAFPTAAPGGQPFSQVLRRADRDTSRQAPAPNRSTQESQARAVSRRRGPADGAAAGREGPAAARAEESPAGTARRTQAARKSSATSREKDSAGDSEAAQTAAAPDASATRSAALAGLPTALQMAGAQPREGEVVTLPPAAPTLAQGYAPSGRIGGTIQAQLGLAAYRLSPHGAGEPALPAPSTPLPLGTALRDAEPDQARLQPDLHVVNASEMVQLSNAARAAAAAGEDGAAQAPGLSREEASRVPRADPNSAQGRNQLLSQIGGPAQGVPQPQTAAIVTPAQAGAGAAGMATRVAAQLKETKAESATADAPASDAAPIPPAGPAVLRTAPLAHDARPAPAGSALADPNLINRIVEQSRWLIRSGHSEATFKLQPEHLGEMRLKVVHKDGNLAVQMTVDSAATKHIVEAGLNDLRQRLQTENLAQGTVLLNVDVRQGSDPGRFAQLAQQTGPDGAARGLNGQPVEQAAPAAAGRPAAWDGSNISIYA